MKKKEKISSAQKDATGLIQMYQAGFLDSLEVKPESKREWKKWNKKCKRAFEFRFANKLQGKVKLNGKKTKMQVLQERECNNIKRRD